MRKVTRSTRGRTRRRAGLALAAFALLASCGGGQLNESSGGVYAPGPSGEPDVDGLIIGHRLMEAGEYELALRAYTRAATEDGLTIDTLSAMGSANLRLGRLNQAEEILRRAVEEDATFPPAWNNLGVILMERGEVAEAAEAFRRAYATDNGNSDQIRDNLRLALARRDAALYAEPQENEEFQLVRRGQGDYLILAPL
ncbi:tetratricopeptide repeat protein [Pseudoroseicyclus sp. CXY001]|uniref:tetratricopeptide repeat protein n=1 Tax=Pseudoroseicyclus sp. CXY001 TaxID=3242492 RepID=UPI003570D85B